jgi:hypothetical protein
VLVTGAGRFLRGDEVVVISSCVSPRGVCEEISWMTLLVARCGFEKLIAARGLGGVFLAELFKGTSTATLTGFFFGFIEVFPCNLCKDDFLFRLSVARVELCCSSSVMVGVSFWRLLAVVDCTSSSIKISSRAGPEMQEIGRLRQFDNAGNAFYVKFFI